VGAIIAIAGYGFWGTLALPVVGSVNLGWWGAVLTVMWIVGLTNAYNFMDGTDGIAGSQAVIAGLGWALIGWAAGIPLVGGIGFLIAGASLGFLAHNWPPARVFMGDIGSAFLGYLWRTAVMYGFSTRTGPCPGRYLLSSGPV
jgi:UDP-N-acetylmuramyl pentapeptide phosphotransferase/UDP-N-acetylglucosamine-1-phosphate transferase